MKRQTRTKRILRFIPMIVVMALIFYFSAKPGDESAKQSNFIVEAIARLVEGAAHYEIPANAVIMMSLIVRKAAHFTEYAILGWAVMFALYFFISHFKASLILPILISVLYAASDEFHQYFVPGRVGTWKDVLIDSCGAITGIVIYYLVWLKLVNTSKSERASKRATRRLVKKARRRNMKENLLL